MSLYGRRPSRRVAAWSAKALGILVAATFLIASAVIVAGLLVYLISLVAPSG